MHLLWNCPRDECHWTLLMISQRWFRLWLGGIRQQAITWANAGPDLCHHMVPLGHNELINSLRPRRNRRHFADDIFKCIFLNENVWIPSRISLKFVPKGPIDNIPAMVRIMAWRRPGDKPLSEPMLVSLPTHICVARPQWVKQVACLLLLFLLHSGLE